MIIEFAKMCPSAMSPDRGHPSDAGLDVYAHMPEQKSVVIGPNENMVIPTGLRFAIPHGYMLQVCNRSSMGAKKSLVVGAHIIDSGYDGEVFIDLHNIGSMPQRVTHYDKIAQIVMVPVVSFHPREVAPAHLYQLPITISDRGAGALGSTDR